jgi:hypothetical protein
MASAKKQSRSRVANGVASRLAEIGAWLTQQTVEIESAGRDANPWRSLESDPRMIQVWRIIAEWPQMKAIQPLLGFAGSLAEKGVPAVLAEPPHNRVGLAWSQYRIGEAARALIVELRTAPDTATRLLAASLEPLILELEGLANRALREADAIEAIARQHSPGVAVHASYDRGPLAYREFMANVIAGLRNNGIEVTLAEQHRLVATLTNVVFGRSGNTEVSARSEERRWQRQNPTNRPRKRRKLSVAE